MSEVSGCGITAIRVVTFCDVKVVKTIQNNSSNQRSNFIFIMYVFLIGTFCVVKWHITVNYNILLKVFSLLHVAMFKRQYEYLYFYIFIVNVHSWS